MPSLLAIETATLACSVALYHQDQFFCRYQLAPKEHTQLILPMIRAVLSEAGITLAQLNALAVGRGPGSFTGVRIAISVAQALSFGLNIPAYPISTLESLAYRAKMEYANAPNPLVIIPALDARMQEVYSSAFFCHNEQISAMSEEKVGPLPLALLSNEQPNLIVGSGWDNYYSTIALHNVLYLAHIEPHAKYTALIALKQWQQGVSGVKAQQILPVYVRDKVADKPKISTDHLI